MKEVLSLFWYILKHRDQRFWQAVSNWSGYHYLGYSENEEFYDLFYKEGK